MNTRSAKNKDKNQILAFCQKTFSWGDYIANVWDSWIKEGTLYVVEDSKAPVGMCHMSVSKNQVWIEGLRINPAFRRRGFASSLVLHVENMAKKRGRRISRMLIAQDNTKSLELAKALGYYIEGSWWLYYIEPKKQKSKTIPASDPKQIRSLDSKLFTESWKWYLLDRKTIARLLKRQQIIVFGQGIGIWNMSDIDKDVLQVGYLDGTRQEIDQLLKYVQNKGREIKSKRIQILVRDNINLGGKDITKRMQFCLMRKDL